MAKRRNLIVVFSMAALLAALFLKDHPEVVLRTDREVTAARYRHRNLLAVPKNERVISTPATSAKRSFLQNTELAELAFRLGKEWGNEAELAHAERLINDVLRLMPRYAPAILVSAEINENRHDFTEAIRLATLAKSLGSHSTADKVLIASFLAMGQLAEAQAVSDQLLLNFPTTTAYLLHALVLEAQGRKEEASFDFKTAALREEVATAEDAAYLRSLWARFLLRTGKPRQANAVIYEALRLFPAYPLALSVKGDIALARGKAGEAAEAYYEAFRLSRNPRYLTAYARAKAALHDTKISGEAITSSIALLRSDLAKSATAHAKDLAEALLVQGSFEARTEAATLMTEEVRKRPGVEVLMLNAEVQLSLQQWEPLGETLSRLFAIGCRQPRLYELAGKWEAERGNKNRAALLLRLARG